MGKMITVRAFVTWLILTTVVLCVMVAAFGRPSASQDVSRTVTINPHHSGIHPDVEKFYQTWNIPPDRKNSCCNKNDCAPATIVEHRGRYLARNHFLAPNMDVEIPPHLLEENAPDPRESPDGQSHVCISMGSIPPRVLCAVRGQGM